MNTLDSLAQNIQDIFLKDYAQESEFFVLYHYKYLAATIYSSILQDQYKISYAKNMSDVGIGFPDLNPEWFIPEEVKIDDKKTATLSSHVFSFIFDAQACSLGEVIPINSTCQEFIKRRADSVWAIKHEPFIAKTWYWLKGPNKVQFSKSNCKDETVLINYLPALDPKSEKLQYIAEGLEKAIIETSVSWLKGFTGDVVVDQTNNANQNKVIESEIDKSFRKTA